MKKYGYVAVRGAVAYMFPSQCVALPVDPDRGVNYLKFYVVDRITDPERGDLGAVVKFAIEAPRSYWLPEWGSTPYEIDYSSKALGDEVALTLPGDNFEAELYGNGEGSSPARSGAASWSSCCTTGRRTGTVRSPTPCGCASARVSPR